jgi:hypothetical protein
MNQTPRAINERATRVPIRVDQYFGETPLGTASGFFYTSTKGTFFTSNWHVVAGRNPHTRKALNANAAIPDRLRLHVPMNLGTESQMMVRWQEFFLPLYADEEHRQAAWLVHPVHRQDFDVAIVPIGGLNETILMSANDPQLDLDDLRLYPSMDVYVIGYPRGMFGGAKLPIWKRGSIASEPDFDIDGKPLFYIDAATREGMSGAPVYAQEVGLWAPKGVTELAKQVIGKGRSFVGVYGGRIGADDEFKAQLGLVWKASGLLEIVESGIPGESSFEMVPIANGRRS